MALANMEKMIVNVPHDRAARLREIAKAEQRPIGGIIRLAIDAWLAERDKEQERVA